VRLVCGDDTLNLSREEGHRLLYHGAMVTKGGVVLRLVGRLIYLTIADFRYTIAARELGQLFQQHRGRALLVKVV